MRASIQRLTGVVFFFPFNTFS